MIKRIIGILASVAVLALVVFTILGSGSYTSMLLSSKSSASTEQLQKEPKKESESSAESKAEKAETDKTPADKAVEPADSLKGKTK